MDRQWDNSRGAYGGNMYGNSGYSHNDDLHRNTYRQLDDEQFESTPPRLPERGITPPRLPERGITPPRLPERDTRVNQFTAQTGFNREQTQWNRDDSYDDRTYYHNDHDDRYTQHQNDRDSYRSSPHDLQSNQRWSGNSRDRNDYPGPAFTENEFRGHESEHFYDIRHPYKRQDELPQLAYDDSENRQKSGQYQPEHDHYLPRDSYKDSNREAIEMKNFHDDEEQYVPDYEGFEGYENSAFDSSPNHPVNLRQTQGHSQFKSQQPNYDYLTPDYGSYPHQNPSPEEHRRYSKRYEFGNGHRNNAYDYNEDETNLHTPRRHRTHSHKRKSSRRSRRERRQNVENELPVSFVDGMKTLVQRRKTLRRRRPLSEMGAKSELNGRMSGFIDSQFNFDNEDDSDEEDKLPSNRNVKKTKSLHRRKIERAASVHEIATLLRDQVLMQEPSKLKGLNLMKYKWSMNWLQFKNWCKNVIYELELWSGAFKIIEGHFGTSTVSYFRFLRWLMFLNMFMSVFVLGIVLLPFLLLPPQGMGSFSSTVTNQCASNFHYQAVYYSTNYTSIVQNEVDTSSIEKKIQDVLQGTGWLENTVLFYGSYYNKTGYIPSDNPAPYNMALAYLSCIGVSFLLSFILLVKNSAKGLKAASVSSGSVSMYCNKVFAAWDFCISQDNTAKLKHRSVLLEIKNELEYQRFQWKRESRTTREKLKLYMIRLLINIVVIAVLGGSLYLIYFTNQKLVKILQDDIGSLNSVVVLMLQFLPSITLMFLSVLVPTIFNKLVVAEDYMPAFAIRITLIRVVLLRLASLGMLMISLYTSLQSEANKVRYEPTNSSSDISCDNPPHPVMNQNATTEPIRCWETYVGQQIYKLVVLNFLVVIGSTYGWEFPRKLIFTKFHEKLKVVSLLGQQTFDLSKSVLDLVYLQTLCWLGMFFSPLLPIMCAFTLFVFFYVKKGSLLTNYLPQQQYGTSKSNSLFMMVLLLSFFLAAIPITYMIGGMNPSQECGPFRIYSSKDYIMFDAVSHLVLGFHGAKDVFLTISDSRVMVAVGLFLCLWMYYFWMVGQANYKLSKSLREQLKIEGQDKQFLVARVNEALSDQ